MHMTELHLQTSSLPAQRVFYTTTLGLPLLEETDASFIVQAGQTRLAFHEARQEEASYHFAFTIAGNAWPQVRAWLAPRVSLLTRESQDVFFIEIWNAHSMYFHDPGGNLVELIAHHDLPEDASSAFHAEEIMHISEIGLVVDDVPEVVGQLHSCLGLDPYKGFSHREFTAVGDISGLFIVVQTGRLWFPTAHERARVAPVQVVVTGVNAKRAHFTRFPYEIVVATGSSGN